MPEISKVSISAREESITWQINSVKATIHRNTNLIIRKKALLEASEERGIRHLGKATEIP